MYDGGNDRDPWAALVLIIIGVLCLLGLLAAVFG